VIFFSPPEIETEPRGESPFGRYSFPSLFLVCRRLLFVSPSLSLPCL
jgi:hypothetical protein